MLLPGGKRQDKPSFPIHIYGFPNQTTGHVADIFHFAGKHPQSRASERLRDTKALTFPACNVSALAAWIFQESIGEGFGKSSDKKGLFFMGPFANVLEVFNTAKEVGRLNRNGCKVINFVKF